MATKRVVADTVTLEPASTPEFTANTEKRRELCGIRPARREPL